MAAWEPRHFIISRKDSIGDVVLTFPMAYMLKKQYPDSKITLLGRTYTEDVARLCMYIDEVVCWDQSGNEATCEDQIGENPDENPDEVPDTSNGLWDFLPNGKKQANAG